MLADVPMGESPIGGACSVATVVISDRGKGDRPVGKLGGRSLAMTTWTEELNSTKRNTNTNNYNESENRPPLSICNSFLSLELSIKFLESSRQSARNTTQRHFSDRGHTQTHLFASECDWSISLIARLSRAYLL